MGAIPSTHTDPFSGPHFYAKAGDPVLSEDRERVIGRWRTDFTLTSRMAFFPVAGKSADGSAGMLELDMDYQSPALRVWRLVSGEERDLVAVRYLEPVAEAPGEMEVLP